MGLPMAQNLSSEAALGPDFVEAISLKPLDGFIPFEVILNCPDLQLCIIMSFHIHLGFSRSNFEKVVSQQWDGQLTWNERDVSRYNAGSMLWLSALTSPMTLTLDFRGKILKLLYLRNGRVDSIGMKGMWVGYDVGRTMGLTLGHSAWQIDRPSNGQCETLTVFNLLASEWAIRSLI